MRRIPKLAAFAASTLTTVSLVATHVGIAHAYEAKGYDVSWPQCGEELPSDGDVRIVGVNGGRPYDQNECLADQYRWAISGAEAAFYMNTANPGTRSRTVNWYGQRSPNPDCAPNNETACAYDYGYNAAEYAWEYAQSQTGAANRHSWWLDVETTNSWSDDHGLNITVILGSIAFLRSQGVPVGIYSTEYQWDVITGGEQIDVPNWLAGASSRAQAARWCAPDGTFTGGPVVMVQWVEHDLDHNHACAPLPQVTAPPPSSGGTPGLDTILADLLRLDLQQLLRDLGLG